MAGDTTPKKKEPTAQEAMFFFAIVKHTRNKADIDWNAVAAEQGFKNADVAKVRFGQVKRKLGINSETPTVASPTATARTPTKKTPSVGGTPTKVVKTPGRAGTKGKSRGKVAKKEESEEEDDDDETVVGGMKEEEEEVGKNAEFGEDEELHNEVDSFLEDDAGDPF